MQVDTIRFTVEQRCAKEVGLPAAAADHPLPCEDGNS